MKNTIRIAREYGEGFVLADQSINTLDDIIIANVETLLSMGLGSPIDIQKAAKSLGLNPEQIDLLIRLPVGNAIGRKFGGKFPYAVHLRFPYRKPIYINDEEIDRINEKLFCNRIGQ